MRRKASLALGLILISSGLCFGQGKGDVVYKFRKYERFDLGNLKIKGSIAAPGDISVKERFRKKFNRQLLERSNFDPEVRDDVYNLR